MRMRHIVICGLPGCAIFFHIMSQTARFSKNSYWTQNVFWFSLQLLSETFLILRRIKGGIIKICIGLYVKYRLFWSDFNETWTFWKYFLKTPQMPNFIKIRLVGAEFVPRGLTEGRSAMTDVANSLFP